MGQEEVTQSAFSSVSTADEQQHKASCKHKIRSEILTVFVAQAFIFPLISAHCHV